MRHASSFGWLAGIAAALAFALPASAADYDYQPAPAYAYAAPQNYAMAVDPPAGAIRYNRPCSVSDGYRTIVVACRSAAAAAAQYAVPVVTYAEPVLDPVVYADYSRYRPHHAYRAARWHHRGHARHRWHAHRRHDGHHGHARH